jgi:hypothetical protein
MFLKIQLKQNLLLLGVAYMCSDRRLKDILSSSLYKASQILEIPFSTMFSNSNPNILEEYREIYSHLAYETMNQLLALDNSDQPSLVSNFTSEPSCLSTNPENMSPEDTIDER